MEQHSDLKFDNEYSRLIGAIGKVALEKLQSNKVLVVGMKGLGLEIAKNIVLMGVKHLTIADGALVQLRDLSSNFFLSESDVGKPRAQSVRAKLQELNDRCELAVHEGAVTEELVSKFRVVVLTDNRSREELVRLAEACHRAGVAVIAADTWGVFGWCFVDMGANHVISDRTGERPKTGYLASFQRDKNDGVCVSIDRHDLEDGMTVQLSEVQGIPGLNGKEFKIRTLGPFIFSIGDISGIDGEYIKGGLFEEVKTNTTVSFESLGTQLSRPLNIWENLVPTDHAKLMDAPQQILLLLALLEFRAAHDGNLPRSHDMHDALEVLDMARALNAQVKHVEDQIDERLISQLAKVSRGDLGPLAAVFGGVIAQEVIKASSSKYTPIRQWSFFDAREILPSPDAETKGSDFVEEGSRYDGQIAVLGNEFQKKLSNLKYFLVGAGAIGCEMLKNWACMGLGTGPQGSILVTDNDIIEISNLNRQFLYRAWDVQHSKSETSAKAAVVMNPAMKIKAYTTKVCTETEDVFNDAFWSGLDGVCNALDNIHARLYVDSKCVYFGKSLLESGTLGTKGNTQVMVPNISQTYGETSDPEPKETAKCLLHSFPSNIEHCLQWARELLFEGEFVVNPEEVNQYIKNPNYLASLTDMDRKKKLDILGSVLLDKQNSFDDCVVWARLLFEEYYVRRPAQLVHTYPVDCKDSAGQPFWQGTRRPPRATPYDAKNPAHVDFVVASSFLRAYILKLIPSEFKPADMAARREHIAKVAAAVHVQPWKPKDNVKIAVDPEKEKEIEASGVSAEDDAHMKKVLAALPSHQALAGHSLNVLDFEKDDDRNFHIDFVYSAANLRAVAYEIPTVSRLQSKLIAGKIIPAIVTTTAVVAGLVCLELIKLALGKNKLEDYRNCFCNLAIPVFNMAEAVAPIKYQFRGKTYTTWDHVEIKEGNLTVAELIDVLKQKHNIVPFQITFPVKTGAKIIYMSFGDYDKSRKVLDLALEELAKEKQKLDPQQRCIKLIITPDDDDDGMDMADDDKPVDQLVLLFVLAIAWPALAQNFCMLNNPVNDKCGVCTANDVRISQLTLLGGPTSCVIGSSITVDVAVQWSSTANGRYDVAAYLAKDGGNALTGTCNEFILSPIGPNPVLGTQANPSLGPFADTNGDQCGDLNSADVVWQRINQVTILCRDQDKDGVADVSGCTSWNQNQNDNTCTGVASAVCGAPSKCRCDAVLNIAGLGSCLSSQSVCAPASDAPFSCNASQFSARVRVTTTANSASTVFPPSAVSTGFIYYNLMASPSQSMAMDLFAPGTAITTASPTVLRRDLINPCKVQRQIFCGATSSCASIAETQVIPRFFHESSDTACAGNVCSGAAQTPSQCTQGYVKIGDRPESIKFLWTLANKITPCAALANDGTFYEFYSDAVPTAGVILGRANILPANTQPFSFVPSTSCTFPQCAIDVELVLVIDEQSSLSWQGFQNVLNFLGSLIGTFNTSSQLTRFGIHFAGSSDASTPPLVLTQNLAPPNLVTNVLLPHVKANGTTNFATAITAAVNKYWSGSPTGVRRELLTIVGGADAGGSSGYAGLQSLYASKNIEAWAIGVESGATMQSVLTGVSLQAGVSYQHYEGIYDTTQLQTNVANQGQILCPQSNFCGTACLGFCSCTTPTSKTCVCPTCSNPNCQVGTCSNAAVGCTFQPKTCNDNNACTANDSCDIASGNCVYAAPTVCSNGTCVNSTGCVPPSNTPCNATVPCAALPCFTQKCVSNLCVPDVAVTCDDGNACTTDSCDLVLGCRYVNVTCTQTSPCFATVCVPGAGSQPNCQTQTTPRVCSDGDSCTVDQCDLKLGCVYANYSCPASNVSCSFPNGCIGTGPTPACLIGNYTCALNAAQIAGISVGLAVGVAIGAAVAVALAVFFSKKGYDYYQSKGDLMNAAASNNPAFKANTNIGLMP